MLTWELTLWSDDMETNLMTMITNSIVTVDMATNFMITVDMATNMMVMVNMAIYFLWSCWQLTLW